MYRNLTTTTATTTKATTPKEKPMRLEKIVSKFKDRGLSTIVDYLLTKGRKSKRTAIAFSYGLDYLNSFIEHNYKGYDISTILVQIQNKEIDVYKLLNSFVPYLQNNTKNGPNLSPKTLALYVAVARSYFVYNDIEISPAKFKYKVSLPPVYREDEEAIDANDIKEILHHCDNRRLKPYLLVLASGGMRAIEALSLRECDIDFSGIDFSNPHDRANPARVHIRKEYAKTRTERNIYISNEAARYLHDWIEWKYRDKHLQNTRLVNKLRSKDDLVFSKASYEIPYTNGKYPVGVYNKILLEFQRVLNLAGLSSRKQDGVYKRRKVTFHSFRRFVKTTIANQTRNSDFSEWFLGHARSPYYTNKPDELKRIYKTDCMPYLTFLDYETLEAKGKSLESQLEEKDQMIAHLRQQVQSLQQRDSMNTDAIGGLTDSFMQLKQEFEQLKKKNNST